MKAMAFGKGMKLNLQTPSRKEARKIKTQRSHPLCLPISCQCLPLTYPEEKVKRDDLTLSWGSVWGRPKKANKEMVA